MSFTGSASTAATAADAPRPSSPGRCGSTPRPTRSTARSSARTPPPGTPEFDLYVKQLVTEMTVKAGQKCTAIRRAFVPARLRRRRRRGRVGPAGQGRRRQPGRRVGADGRAGQPRPARGGAPLAQGAARRPARPCSATPSTSTCVGADAERGAFISPVLLRPTTPSAPSRTRSRRSARCSTLIGYRDAAHAIELAARGQGSLAGSVVTDDPDFAREVVLGVAPWHGRLLVLDRDDARRVDRARLAAADAGARRPRPGRRRRGAGRHARRAAPHAAHRGPGAARACSTAITGRWVPGASAHDDGVHPFRKSLAELRIGDSVTAGPRTVTAGRHRALRRVHRRHVLRPHRRRGRGRATRSSAGIVAHGYLVVSLAAGLFVDPDPGPGARQLRHRQPALPHAGLAGRRAHGDPDLQGRSRPAATATTARCAGTPRSPSRTAIGRRAYDVLTMVAKEWPHDRDRARPRGSTSTTPSRTTAGSSRATGCRTATARR